MDPLLALLPSLSLALTAPSHTGPRPAPDAERFQGKAVDQEESPHTQGGARTPHHAIEDEIRIGEASFAVEWRGTRVRFATTAGGAVTTTGKAGRSYTLRWNDDGRRRIEIRLVEVAEGDWRYFHATTYEFEIADVSIRLVDCDADGVFGELDQDGFCLEESNAVCPLQDQVVIANYVVRFESIDAEGKELVASLTRVQGTDQQLDCLREVNRLRMSNGLPPVLLDPELSAGCSAHASYLEQNRWTGLTNPHDQTLGPEGASPAGKSAAARSVIGMSVPADAVVGFWKTYYHRIDLMRPDLSLLGVNAEPEGIAVVDVRSSGAAWAGELSGPVVVPASGSKEVPTESAAELPMEPVPELASRGFPVILVFPRNGPVPFDFTGRLRRIGGSRDEEVPVLIANQGQWPNVLGIVPEEPLAHKAVYVAELAYTLASERITEVVRFETK